MEHGFSRETEITLSRLEQTSRGYLAVDLQKLEESSGGCNKDILQRLFLASRGKTKTSPETKNNERPRNDLAGSFANSGTFGISCTTFLDVSVPHPNLATTAGEDIGRDDPATNMIVSVLRIPVINNRSKLFNYSFPST